MQINNYRQIKKQFKKMQWNIEKIFMITNKWIKFSWLDDPYRVDMPLNKLNQTIQVIENRKIVLYQFPRRECLAALEI